jgi:AhpD family alkylhydroperoxidase
LKHFAQNLVYQGNEMYELIDPQAAKGHTKELLDATQQQLGRVPNLYKAMANSPVGLSAYLAFRKELQNGILDVGMRERIALLTAQLNSCDYCIAAHSFRAEKVGLSSEDIKNTRHARSDSMKTNAALQFVKELIHNKGSAEDETKNVLVESGWNEAEIGEMVAHVALNVFSNYFKQVAQPELDFPAAADLLA